MKASMSAVPSVAITGSDPGFRRRPVLQTVCLSSRIETKPTVSVSKPLHVSSAVSFFEPLKPRKSLIKCQAYEADKSEPLEPTEVAAATTTAAAQKAKIGIYFATWWALNVVFNIYNKKVLNAYPYPWLTSTLSLACGSLMMLISWATGIAEAPKTDFDFWKTLFPVSIV